MKYIENPALSRLAQSLSHEGPECSVNVRMEAYSCKNIKRDKKLFKSLEEAYSNDHDSPPLAATLLEPEMTPFGPIDNHSSRKTLYLLISTLNIAFPDHEFSDVRPAQFNREESGASVLNALSTTLVAPHRAGINAPRTYGSYPSNSPDLFPSSLSSGGGMSSMSPLTLSSMPRSPFSPPAIVTGTHPHVYRLVDDVIGLEECEVYSYTPEIESDPHTVGDFDSDDEEELRDEDDEDEYEGIRISTNKNGRWDEDATFEFDDYDIDESPRSSNLNTLYSSRRRPSRHIHPGDSASSSVTNSPDAPNNPSIPPRMRPRHSMSAPLGGFKASRLPPRDNSMANVLATPISMKYQPRRRSSRGALLWSSHWFFLSRKQKRILFISVWARSRGAGRTSWDGGREDLEEGYPSSYGFGGDDDLAEFDEDYLVLVVDEPIVKTVKTEEVEGAVGGSNSGKERFVGWEGGAGAGARAIGLVQG